jgi:glutamate transport system substrate-binding protein
MSEETPRKTITKSSIIATVVVLCVVLVGAVVLLANRTHKESAVTETPCLDTGKCMVGVSYSDAIPGFRVKNGKEYFGFDVDIAHYITNKLGRGAPVFVQTDRDKSLTDSDRPVDMFVSTVSMTDGRLAKMTFVGPYMRTFQGIMVKDESLIEGPDDLVQKSICTAEDTTSEDALEAYAKIHPIDARSEATIEQCISGVKEGKYDAVTGDYVTLQTYAHSDATLRPVSSVKISSGYELYGIALPRESMALCQKIKPLLKDFIREKWESAFDSNLKSLGITYDPTDTALPSLKPGENLVDINSCQ